jgi:CTP:molybdopterin cytidylyltransferase MocA
LILRDGEPLVRRNARALIDAGATPVVVVLGARAETIAPVLSGLNAVTVIVNHEWSNGIASSLVAGVSAVFADDSCEAVLVTLADQPLVDARALRRLIAAFDDDHRIIASAYNDTLGVPAIFAREHANDLLRLTGDTGAAAWLRRRAKDVTRVPLKIATVDIDTPSDLARAGRVPLP